MRSRDEVKRDLVRQWLAKADADLGACEHLAEISWSAHHITGFHAQQAAEKYLKAFLTQHQIEFPKTHDIGELLALASKRDPKLAESLREAAALTPYGVESRYPANVPDATADMALKAVHLARLVRAAVFKALPPDARES